MKGKKNESYHEALNMMIRLRHEARERIISQRDKQLVSKEFAKQKVKEIDKELQLLKVIEEGYTLNHE